MQDLPTIVDKLRPYLSSGSRNIIELQALRFELAEARVEALELLMNKRRQMLYPKDKNMTELDRKTRLDGDVAVYERNYQFLLQLEEIVKDRIELAKFYKTPKG